MVTSWTVKAIRPANLEQIITTGLFCSETLLELKNPLWIIFHTYKQHVISTEVNWIGQKYYLKELIQLYIKKDIKDIGRIRNIMKFNNLLRSLADQAGNIEFISLVSCLFFLSF